MRQLQQRQIEAFHAVCELGGVGVAAVYLNVTQPAVSHLLRALEKSVGFKLFEHRGRNLVPNADGLLFFEEVNRSMEALSSLKVHSDAIREQRVGRVRVAATPAYVDNLVASIIGDFLLKNPNIFIEIESYGMTTIIEMVEMGRIDLGIIGVSGKHPQLLIHHTLNTEAVLVLHPDHPLAEKKIIALRDLNGQRFISIGKGSPFRFEVDLMFRRHAINPKIVAEVRTQHAIATMVKAGAGVSLIDRKLAEELSGTGFVFRETKPRIRWKICLVTRRQRQLSQALGLLINQMKQGMLN